MMKSLPIRVSPQIIVLVLVIVAIAAFFASQSDTFLSAGNISNILLQSSAIAIAAVGMTFVISAGWIDLSVGSLINVAVVIALSVSGVTSAANGDSSIWTYIVIFVVAILGGVFNALLIQFLKVHPLLVTLGTLTLFRGIALHITGGGNRAADGVIQILGREQIFGIALPIVIALAVIVIGDVTLRKTTFGRHVMAIGGSQRSAIETGLPINRVRLYVFMISGFCAALAGIIIVGRIGTVQTSLGSGFEFTIITAVIIGGTSIFGGKGSVVGSALGALLLTLIDNGLNRIDASIYVYDVVRGLVLVGAVLADSLISGRLQRFAASRRKKSLAPRAIV
jgi:ribose transport system permease protein